MKTLFLTLSILLFTLVLQGDPLRTVIVANSSSKQSLEVARYYAQQRGIPEANILTVEIPGDKQVLNWQEYVRMIHNPLLGKLVEQQWVQASPRWAQDQVGRNLYNIRGHNMAYLVTVFGVPLKVSSFQSRIKGMIKEEVSKHIQTDAAAVDSELSIMLLGGLEPFGPQRNPLFQQLTPPPELDRVIIRVGRLDGATPESAKALVDRALEGEKNPLWGRAYVDVKGIHQEGNRWMQEIGKKLQDAGWDTDIRNENGTYKEGDRFDAPAFYFGWYTEHLNGPFIDQNTRFSPGAIAFHLHSFSASQLRNPVRNWCSGLIERGAALTFGNVYEPTLGFSHHPHLFLEALLAGKSAGFAAYYAHPALGWMGVLLGDPLYKPNFGDVLKNPEASALARGYATLSKVAQLDQRSRYEQAIATAEEFLQSERHLPLAKTLATLYQQRASTTPKAASVLIENSHPELLLPEQSGLIRETALQLFRSKDYPQSIALFRWLLEHTDWSGKLRQEVVTEARLVASTAGDQQAEDEFSALLTPTPSEAP